MSRLIASNRIKYPEPSFPFSSSWLRKLKSIKSFNAANCTIMASLSNFPSFFISSPSFQKLNYFHSPLSVVIHHQQFDLLRNQHPPRKHFAVCFSSIRKSRASRKLMSDEDLCNELREIISSAGFSEDHVPSIKELSEHGRKDLAYIVRRRGYKLISELLANSRKKRDEKVDNVDEDISLLSEDPVINGSTEVECVTVDPVLNASVLSFINYESKTKASLQKKVEKFIHNGELNLFEDHGYSVVNESDGDEIKGDVKLDKARKIELDTLGEERTINVLSRSNDAALLNGNIVTFEKTAPHSTENYPLRDDVLPNERTSSDNSNNDTNVETSEVENQNEINQLKLKLHQKELELTLLKEQIEKEKIALSALQIKVESEISKAQKLVEEQDEELQAVEESLLGLKEVQIHYHSDGEIVEVAGSFNGWYDRLKMDPQPSSSKVDPTGSGKSRLWSTVLWLYPGEYEIKFVVDGHWMIDPQRESITRGAVQNNILRVG